MTDFFKFCDEAFKEIVERVNLKDSSGVNYLAQVSTDRDNPTPRYWFQISNLGHLLHPITWCNEDPEWIKQDVEKFISELNFDAIEISYYESMAEQAKKISENYQKLADDNRHRLALEGPTKISDVRKGKGRKHAKN